MSPRRVSLAVAFESGPTVAFDVDPAATPLGPGRVDVLRALNAAADASGLADDEALRVFDGGLVALLALLGAGLAALRPGGAAPAEVRVAVRDAAGRSETAALAGTLYNRARLAARPLALALQDAEAAVALDPLVRTDPRTRALAFDRRAVLRHATGDLGGAAEDFDTALALDPSLALAFNNRAMLRLDTADPNGALADARDAVRLAPDTPLYRLSLAEALVARNAPGDADEALALVADALAADPALRPHLADAAYDPLRHHPRFPETPRG